jgi:hypothetical protein
MAQNTSSHESAPPLAKHRALHDFLTSNRDVLIERCRAKVAMRFPPSGVPALVEHGVPLFLQQLADTLRSNESSPADSPVETTPSSSTIGRSAALHGAEMLRDGFTIDQVVHEYGDVCQAVTELAADLRAPISVDEFHTLNRCLDNAIADAVTSFGRDKATAVVEETDAAARRFQTLVADERRLMDMAIKALTAIKTGNVGVSGSTGTVLFQVLFELRDLIEQSASGPAAPPVFTPRK